MKKYLALSLLLLLSLPACREKQTKKGEYHNRSERMAQNSEDMVSVPMAEEMAYGVDGADQTIESFFADDSEELMVQNIMNDEDEGVGLVDAADREYAENERASEFKKIYFDFGKHGIRKDQEKMVAEDARQAAEMIATLRQEGRQVCVSVEGHADDAAGNATYNMALSEKRAKAVAEKLAAAGVPQECIKVVGHGFSKREMVNGKPVVGTRDQQALNRRVEIVCEVDRSEASRSVAQA